MNEIFISDRGNICQRMGKNLYKWRGSDKDTGYYWISFTEDDKGNRLTGRSYLWYKTRNKIEVQYFKHDNNFGERILIKKRV